MYSDLMDILYFIRLQQTNLPVVFNKNISLIHCVRDFKRPHYPY